MKKLILILLLCTIATYSQTVIQGNLLVENNMIIGQNCGQIQTITYTGDCNFNGDYLLQLKGVNLIILGNYNGTGRITSFCNNNISDVCGNFQPNSGITLTGVTYCGNTLSSPIFNIQKDFGYKYTVYDLTGRAIFHGITNENMYQNMPKIPLIIKVEGFETIKTFINQ